jgi:hypothetical protein
MNLPILARRCRAIGGSWRRCREALTTGHLGVKCGLRGVAGSIVPARVSKPVRDDLLWGT